MHDFKCNEFTLSRFQLTNAPGQSFRMHNDTPPILYRFLCIFWLCFRTSFSRKPGYKHTGSNYCLDQVLKAKYWTRPWFSLMRDAHWWKFPSNFSLWYLDQNSVFEKKSYLINSLSFYLVFFILLLTQEVDVSLIQMLILLERVCMNTCMHIKLT